MIGSLGLLVWLVDPATVAATMGLLDARKPYSLPARIGNENLLISKTMRAGAKR
jgi:hypothetical protein